MYLTQNWYTHIETNKKNITDRTIADICREFNVNEKWLRYGIEPIRIESDNSILSKVIEEYNIKDEVIITIMKNFLNMSNDDKLDLINKANMLLASTQNIANSKEKNNVIPLEYTDAKYIARTGESGITPIKISDIDKLIESDEEL